MNIKTAIIDGIQKSKVKVDKIKAFLSVADDINIKEQDIKNNFDKVLEDINRQFTVSITKEDIGVPVTTEMLRASVTHDRVIPAIKGWKDEQILRIRDIVEENVSAGFRAEKLISAIQRERDVSFNKAKFIAKQETSMLVSEYSKSLFEDVGVEYYQWSTSHDVRVRKDHRDLNGEIFRFDDPPVTNKQTGARNNPGMDFGCRCVAIPILSTRDALERKYATK